MVLVDLAREALLSPGIHKRNICNKRSICNRCNKCNRHMRAAVYERESQRCRCKPPQAHLLLLYDAMALNMRPTGLGHGLYKDVPDYSIFCGEWCIGRIYETPTGPADLRWFWALHAPSQPGEMRTNQVATQAWLRKPLTSSRGLGARSKPRLAPSVKGGLPLVPPVSPPIHTGRAARRQRLLAC